MFFPKSGLSFNGQGAVNHARNFYNSMEDAYKDIHGIILTPICPYCNINTLQFKNLTKGYKLSCMDNSCKTSQVVKTNRELANNRVDENFTKYIDKNRNFYRLVFIDKINYFDFYLNRVINGGNIGRYSGDTTEEKTCQITGSVYIVDYIKYKRKTELLVGPWQGTRVYRNNTYEDILNYVSAKQLFETQSLKFKINFIYEKNIPDGLVKLLLCNSDYNIYKRKNTNQLVFFGDVPVYYKAGNLNRVNLDNFLSSDYLFKHYPDAHETCKNCKSLYALKSIFYNFDKMLVEYIETNKSPHSCGLTCYRELMKTRKSELFYEYTQEDNDTQSIKMKENIRTGKFTPAVTNSWCKSRVSTNDKSLNFRSTWEAAFYVANASSTIELEYETIRIPYFDPYKKKMRMYMVDFVDRKNKILYEIKPDSELSDNIVKAKESSAIIWCNDNGYEYKIIGDLWFHNNVNEILIDKISKSCTINKDLAHKRLKQFL